MRYKGNVYGKINGRYIQLTETIEDLENKIEKLEAKVKSLTKLDPDRPPMSLSGARSSALKWWKNLKTATKLREFYQHADHLESTKPSQATDKDIEKLYRWHYA